MSGLGKTDDFTLTVTLSKRAGYFFTLVGLWPFWVVVHQARYAGGQRTISDD